MKELRFWGGAVGPFTVLCGGCGREYSIEEFEQLPKKMYYPEHPERDDCTHICHCGYVFGEKVWSKRTPAIIIFNTTPKRRYKVNIQTTFLEASYDGVCYETSISSRDLSACDVCIPARNEEEALENHTYVKLFLKYHLFRVTPDTKHPNIIPRLTLAETPIKSPKKSESMELYKIIEGRQPTLLLAPSPEIAADKILLLLRLGLINGVGIRGPGPKYHIVLVEHDEGYFYVWGMF